MEKIVNNEKKTHLMSREYKSCDSVFDVCGTKIGGESCCVIAGPCSIESEKQIIDTAIAVKAAGANFLRGGVFKPRTSPYSFQGLGIEGLKLLKKAKEETGLPIVTEVLEPVEVPLIAEYADILQIGTRNMRNYALLKACGRIEKIGMESKPILLKRAMSATLNDLLMSAEYIMNEGNHKVILCERGIRTFSDHTRNTLDLSIVPVLKEMSHLPVIVDPSHATGKASLVIPMSRAAVACGAQGLLVEVHPEPSKALSDSCQTLDFEQFNTLMKSVRKIYSTVQEF